MVDNTVTKIIFNGIRGVTRRVLTKKKTLPIPPVTFESYKDALIYRPDI